MEKFLGKWSLDSTENFDEYMQAIGVGWFLRKMGNQLKPTMEISQDGDTYTLRTLSTFKNTMIEFKLGTEFEEESAEGKKLKTTVTLDGNKLVQSQTDEIPRTLTRTLVDDKTIQMTLEAGGVTAKRVYKKMDA